MKRGREKIWTQREEAPLTLNNEQLTWSYPDAQANFETHTLSLSNYQPQNTMFIYTVMSYSWMKLDLEYHCERRLVPRSYSWKYQHSHDVHAIVYSNTKIERRLFAKPARLGDRKTAHLNSNASWQRVSKQANLNKKLGRKTHQLVPQENCRGTLHRPKKLSQTK